MGVVLNSEIYVKKRFFYLGYKAFRALLDDYCFIQYFTAEL